MVIYTETILAAILFVCCVVALFNFASGGSYTNTMVMGAITGLFQWVFISFLKTGIEDYEGDDYDD